MAGPKVEHWDMGQGWGCAAKPCAGHSLVNGDSLSIRGEQGSSELK